MYNKVSTLAFYPQKHASIKILLKISSFTERDKKNHYFHDIFTLNSSLYQNCIIFMENLHEILYETLFKINEILLI